MFFNLHTDSQMSLLHGLKKKKKKSRFGHKRCIFGLIYFIFMEFCWQQIKKIDPLTGATLQYTACSFRSFTSISPNQKQSGHHEPRQIRIPPWLLTLSLVPMETPDPPARSRRDSRLSASFKWLHTKQEAKSLISFLMLLRTRLYKINHQRTVG